MIVVHSPMAKSNNLPAKRYKAGERTERTLRFQWDAGANGGSVYIDIAMAMSAINRRFYRQGLYYYVSNAYFVNGSMAHVQINTLPDTYVTKLAWERGFKKWSEMNRKAANDSSGTIYPAYHDFKTQMINGVSLMGPKSADHTSAVNYGPDEWVISKFVSDDPGTSDPQTVDTFVTHMLGGHVAGGGAPDVWTSVGLIRSLNDTWRQPTATGEPTLDGDMDTDPLGNLFDAGDTHDDIRLNLDADNDLTPYDANSLIGSASVHEVHLAATGRTSSGSGALVHMGGFCVPLGLIEVDVTDFGDGGSIGDVELVLELTPGTYHGVYAERIL